MHQDVSLVLMLKYRRLWFHQVKLSLFRDYHNNNPSNKTNSEFPTYLTIIIYS